MDDFVADLGDEAYQNFYALLDGLQVVERRFWRRPQFDALNHGIDEIRFSGDHKTYRVFGYLGPRRLHFTMLAGYVKKRDLRKEIKRARKRKKFAEENEHLLYEFTF